MSSTLTANCSLAGLTAALTVPFTTVDTPDPAVAGGPVALSVQTTAPSFPGFDFTVTAVTFSFPVPAQLASIDSVTFTGGNLTGSYAASATNVDVTVTGSVASSAIVLPTFVINATTKASAAGQSVVWVSPTAVSVQLLAGTTALAATCAPTASSTLNTTTLNAAPTTTVPTTTTTTTKPTTTTTKATTTTTKATTTTRPTTTTTTVVSVIIKNLLCLFFRIC